MVVQEAVLPRPCGIHSPSRNQGRVHDQMYVNHCPRARSLLSIPLSEGHGIHRLGFRARVRVRDTTDSKGARYQWCPSVNKWPEMGRKNHPHLHIVKFYPPPHLQTQIPLP